MDIPIGEYYVRIQGKVAKFSYRSDPALDLDLGGEYKHTANITTFIQKQQSENDGKLRSSNNDKWRNSALQEQVIKLQSRLREYEGDTESVQSSSSRRSTRSEYSPRIPRTPSGSYSRRDSSSRKSGRDDISTYTETTF